jgi:hypothetical protein
MSTTIKFNTSNASTKFGNALSFRLGELSKIQKVAVWKKAHDTHTKPECKQAAHTVSAGNFPKQRTLVPISAVVATISLVALQACNAQQTNHKWFAEGPVCHGCCEALQQKHRGCIDTLAYCKSCKPSC